MRVSDLDLALLELAVQRQAITPVDREKILRDADASTDTDVASAVSDLLDSGTFSALCAELPAFFVGRGADPTRKLSVDRPRDVANEVTSRKPAPPPPEVGPLPARIGPYLVEAVLGRGGFGVVYRVREESSGKAFALKLLTDRSDDVNARRFSREARALSQIRHPNVVRIVDFGEDEGKNLYYVMELLPAETLSERIARRGRLDTEEARRIARDVLLGLGAVHEKGILHRDIKPSNLLVTTSGRTLIIDFSIARLPQQSLTLTQDGYAVGTPVYMAPEQIETAPHVPASDLYAVGVTLWQALEGVPPYDHSATWEELFIQKLQRPPPRLRRKDVPIWFERFVLTLMSKRVEDRYPDVPAAIAALDLGEGRRAEASTGGFGKYELLSEIGRGASAIVHRARTGGREVALKVMEVGADAGAIARLTRESRALVRIDHPNVVKIHEAGIHEGRSFMALEWVDGCTLEQLCLGGPLPIPAVLSLGVQIARGLAACHARGVIHRDLKPENVLVTVAGDAKIVDFGLASLEDSIEAPSGFAGTPAYTSPEQCRGEPATRRSDLYALGLVLLRLAIGRRPFQSDTVAGLLYQQLHEDPPSLRQERPEAAALAPVVASLVAKNPGDRYSSADALAEDLALLANGSVPENAPLQEA